MSYPNIDGMVRRHAKGDRSPALMAELSRLAWEAFHAPWEEPPKPSASLTTESEAPECLSDTVLRFHFATQELVKRVKSRIEE